MFTFLIIFAIFLIILNVTIRKNDSKQNKCEEDFWEQERQANFARRKDISNLQYLTIPIEKIPHNLLLLYQMQHIVHLYLHYPLSL